MAKSQSRFVCQACGNAFLRWEGQCRSCSAWNTLVETVVREPARSPRRDSSGAGRGSEAVAEPLAQVADARLARLQTGIAELDRVLGGGLVPGSLILLAGEPGIGKSTLVLQAAAAIASRLALDGGHVLYATGEESAAQVRLRAARLGLLDGAAGQAIRLAAASQVADVTELARSSGPAVVIVDSIQTATVEELDGPAGSVGQVRESAVRYMDLAKGDGLAVILVGHVTKDGTIAGPKTLEHVVDAVLGLEGDRSSGLRLLRASKNRYGSTEEVGVFEMGERGLVEVSDPARAFLVDRGGGAPGSVVAPTLEGSRPLLVEVQALVAPVGYGNPRRTGSGIDPNRLAVLIAVLHRRAGVGLGSHDVYVNLAGGLSLDEPGLDLPIALALASSLRDQPIDAMTVAIGEVGLLGELRTVAGVERRLHEAARLGFERAIVPQTKRGKGRGTIDGLDIVAVSSLREAIAAALLRGGRTPSAPSRDEEAAVLEAPITLGG